MFVLRSPRNVAWGIRRELRGKVCALFWDLGKVTTILHHLNQSDAVCNTRAGVASGIFARFLVSV